MAVMQNAEPEPRIIYYAHPMSWYGTDHEKADLQAIKLEFPEFVRVINPGSAEIERLVDIVKQKAEAFGQDARMAAMLFFQDLVRKSDAVVYRSFKDGKIGSGVAQEIFWAHVHEKPVFRLYSGCTAEICGAPKLIRGTTGDLLWETLTVRETKQRIRGRIL